MKFIIFFAFLFFGNLHADEGGKSEAPVSEESVPNSNEEKQPIAKEEKSEDSQEPLDLESIKKQYWSRSSKHAVLQNRLYQKTGGVEISVLAGEVSSDPFLSIYNIGGTLSYHISEFFTLTLLGWRSYATPSQALTIFETEVGATTNTNPPFAFVGSEFSTSIIYAKGSLLGLSIIHYDLSLSVGSGVTFTESGNPFTQMGGIGQRIYLNEFLSIHINARLTHYRETIIEKVRPKSMGEVLGERDNWSGVFTGGIGILFSIGGEN